MGKRYNQSENQKYQQFDDDFEDFGYEVKNIRRQTKKKVTKFKRETDIYDDSFWTVHYFPHSSRLRVLYTCWRDFFMLDDIKMPCEIALEADAELMKLFEEIDNERGQDSAFMDDNFGG